MYQYLIILISIFVYVNAQRAPPGVNPQHYQPQQQPQYQQQQYQQQPQYQQVPQQHMPPQQQVPVQQQYQQPQQQPQQHQHGGHQQGGQLFDAANMEHEKEHLGEHLKMEVDTSKMTDQELQFHYFKMHDADNNNMLDGCELIKSLIHWHEQGHGAKGQVEEKIFKDEELVNLIDPILNVDDGNKDGYIDYPEFIRAQQKAAAQKQDKPQQ